MSFRWHDIVLAFFGAGLVAGLAFAVAGPIAPIRALGLAAIVFAALGVWVMTLALRNDHPEHWDELRSRGDTLLAHWRARLADAMPGYAAAENLPA
jgi:hypothetical protein